MITRLSVPTGWRLPGMYVMALVATVALLAIGCSRRAVPRDGGAGRAAGQTPPSQEVRQIPADHTKDKKGTRHKPGYKKATTEGCVQCHGTDLKGGDRTPSCFKCHDQKWK